MTATVALNLNVPPSSGRSVELDLGARNGADPGCLGRAPEPGVEVAAERLLPDGLAPHAGDDDRDGSLAPAEARHAERLGHVRGGVLERVRDVLLGNLDVEADAAFRKLFDLRLHEGHCVRRA